MTEHLENTAAVAELPPFAPRPNSIIPVPLFSGETAGQGLFTYLVEVAGTFEAAVYVWNIKGPDVNILVDAGDKASTMVARGLDAKPCIEGLAPDDDPVSPGLAKLGLTPEEIDIVILTQLHDDHCALAHLFTKAKFIVQRAELHAARHDPPRMQEPMYKKKLFEGLDFQVIEGDVQIAEGVWALYTPGHTRGGQSVVVDTPQGRAVISGLCTIQKNFEPPEPYASIWPVIPPGIHCDLEQAYQSVLRIKTLADIPISLHDGKWTRVTSIP